MYPRIMHIIGPFWIQSYGVMIVLGFLLFLLLTFYNKKRREMIDDDHFLNVLCLGLVAGLLGGRALFMFYEWGALPNPWIDMFLVWEGGFVVLGSIIGVLLTLSVYLSKINVPVLKFFDFIAVYAPLLQSISRIGCFLSGCCYGAECHNSLLAVTFTNPNSIAPLNVSLYPTQLYLSLTSFLIFVVLFLLRNVLNKNGQILFAYLCLDSAARFFVDFYRGDRGELMHFKFLKFDLSLSQIQIWVLVILILSLLVFFTSLYKKRSKNL